MSTLSLRIPDELLHEVDIHADLLQLPRAAYVRKALEQMNATVEAHRRRMRLIDASMKVRDESISVNREFSAFEDLTHA